MSRLVNVSTDCVIAAKCMTSVIAIHSPQVSLMAVLFDARAAISAKKYSSTLLSHVSLNRTSKRSRWLVPFERGDRYWWRCGQLIARYAGSALVAVDHDGKMPTLEHCLCHYRKAEGHSQHWECCLYSVCLGPVNCVCHDRHDFQLGEVRSKPQATKWAGKPP